MKRVFGGDEIMKRGILIKKYIQSCGMKQTFLAAQSGISSKRLNMMLNGRMGINADDYILICRALGKNIEDFEGDVGQADRS